MGNEIPGKVSEDKCIARDITDESLERWDRKADHLREHKME